MVVSSPSPSIVRLDVDTASRPIREVLDIVLALVPVADLSVVDPPLEQVIGEIYHGAEHAKSGLVVWPAGSVEVNQLAMFVAGISGETAAVINPITAEEIVLRKTLRRDYLIPGEALPRGSEPAGQVSESWVMR